MKSFITSALLTLLLLGCSGPSEKLLSHEEKRSIELEVNKTFDQWTNAPKQNFEEHFLKFMHLDGDIAMASDGTITAGGDALRKYLKVALKDVDYISDFQIPNRHTHVLTRNVAVITVNYEEKIHLKTGDVVISKGGFQYVFQKFDENWKVVNMAGTHTN